MFRGGVVVGSQADAYAHGDSPKRDHDWDIVVPHTCWREAAMQIPRSKCQPNGNRGWRFAFEEGAWSTTCDVWPDDLMRFLIESTNYRRRQVFAFDINGYLFTADRDRSDD